MSKSKKIWEKIYGDKEFVFDFSNQLILKDEYKTEKPYSWDYDFYDYEDETETKFIANEKIIKARNKQPMFDFEGLKYLSVRNEDSTYSILTPSKLLDLENPLNFDLYLANKLSNYKSSNYIVLSITYKKMLPTLNDIFISYICDCVKAKLDFDYMKLDNNNQWKNKLYFLIDKNKYKSKDVLDAAMIFKPLLKLFILRSYEKFEDIWNDDEDIHDGLFFNIFLFTTDKRENIFILNEKEFVNYTESFEEKIMINENIKNELIEIGMLSNDFLKLYEFNNTTIYSYNFINSKFNAYYMNQKNKK